MIDARAAVVFAEGADPELADVQVRPPADDEVLVHIEAVGICHTAAIDTTALAPVIAGALAALQACGTLALVGLGAITAEVPVGLVMAKGLRVRGVVEGDSDPHVFIPRWPSCGVAASCLWRSW